MSWIEDPEFATGKPFGPQTLPYGVLVTGSGPVVAVRVGRHALPLRGIADRLGPRLAELVVGDSLDPLLAAGRSHWQELRERLTELVTTTRAPAGAELVRIDWHTSVLPFSVADYFNFFSSRHHAQNMGRLMRRGSRSLPENWTHLPVAHHGRAGTVCVSGTDIRRPSGQRKSSGDMSPNFGPTRRLDFGAEVGFVCGGEPAAEIPTAEFAEHVFGVVLVNDWSARDIQAWEYQPLGPFLAKSFATSVGAWITPLAALDAAWVPAPEQDPPVLDYLRQEPPRGLDLAMSVRWNGTVVARPPFKTMYWTPAQQLAHLTVNGASVRTGDLFASGTVSGPEREQVGSFLELTWGGTEPVRLQGNGKRTFLCDGDTVVLEATAPATDGGRLTLAEVSGTVLPARPE